MSSASKGAQSGDESGGKKPRKARSKLKTGVPAVEQGPEAAPPAPAQATTPRQKLLQAKAELMRVMNAADWLGTSWYGKPADISTRANISGFAIGEKVTGGHYTNQQAVKVYVTRKLPPSKVADEAKIPATVRVDGKEYPTDVVEVGEVFAQAPVQDAVTMPVSRGVGAEAAGAHTGRKRPAMLGSSIGHFAITAGTLGALVSVNGELMILSNNHVLANSNQGKKGDRILQPGSVDGGQQPRDVIANLFKFVPLKFGGQDNEVDAALANNTNFDLVSPEAFAFVIDPTVVEDPSADLIVCKDGRTTGFTKGHIRDLHASIRVTYEAGQAAVFHDQIRITALTTGQAFSKGGDSGSLIVSADKLRPVALLFAGSGTDTFATPIRRVMDALGIDEFVATADDGSSGDGQGDDQTNDDQN